MSVSCHADGQTVDGGTARCQPRVLPRWFEALLAGLLVAVATFGLIGVSLAMVEAYRAHLALLVALPAAGATTIMWLRSSRGRAPRSAHAAAAFMMVAAALLGGFHLSESSDTLLAGRDPGVYVATGFWLERNEGLTIAIERETFGDNEALFHRPPGFAPTADGGRSLHIQFPHLYGVLLSAGAKLGGIDGLLGTTSILGALALLAIFALGCQLTKPWLSALGTVAYGLSYPFAHFVRTATSEVPTQLFLFGGAWLVLVASRRSWLWLRFPAAWVAGAAAATRIDALLVLLGVFAYLGWELLDARRRSVSELRSVLPGVLLSVVGGTCGAVVGWVDMREFSPFYLEGHSSQYNDMVAAGIGLGVLTVATLVLWPALARAGALLRPVHVAGAALGSIVVVGSGLWAYLVRPHHNSEHVPPFSENYAAFVQALQHDAGVPLDPTRTYTEQSAVWLATYLSPIGFLGALVALGFALFIVLRRPSPEWVMFLLLVLPASALYVWSHHISPDQPWAMRRFLLVTLPGAALLFVIGAGWLGSAAAGRLPRRIALVGVGLVAVIPLGVSVHQTSGLIAPEGRPLRDVTASLCDRLGPDAAVLIAPESRTQRIPLVQLPHSFSVIVRTACNVPVVNTTHEPTGHELTQIARAVDGHGRRLAVLSAEPFGVRHPEVTTEARLLANLRIWYLLRVLNARSTTSIPYELALYMTWVEPRAGRA